MTLFKGALIIVVVAVPGIVCADDNNSRTFISAATEMYKQLTTMQNTITKCEGVSPELDKAWKEAKTRVAAEARSESEATLKGLLYGYAGSLLRWQAALNLSGERTDCGLPSEKIPYYKICREAIEATLKGNPVEHPGACR